MTDGLTGRAADRSPCLGTRVEYGHQQSHFGTTTGAAVDLDRCEIAVQHLHSFANVPNSNTGSWPYQPTRRGGLISLRRHSDSVVFDLNHQPPLFGDSAS